MASRRPRERRLAEMSVDEFMDKGMSSDEESEVEGDKEVPHLRTKYEQSKWKRRFVYAQVVICVDCGRANGQVVY